ncbi:alpha-L-arabinofuranosidase C-terminal domain-containing protein [Mucilaginibacter sp. BT774]|uniref:alpha-L-arabinofuranosidase C-terminal domain-containing protein n=1 Tax=Mucilaginibacter sp. BT774 TaxID=3062276 RepID=UPI0026746B7A|nr:alpha-L-arabinofuranosidase C-terminal domain-containing protein [Mucilaginibacter sp. BT774]MDO3626199.1 alpha-L-arabinofuranosidase C-terminal domain-containing protein [Mucilaginibacter sp. BT774]
MKRYLLMLWAIVSYTFGYSQSNSAEKIYTIDADKIKAHIQPTMYGIFFEDINMAGDGGVYAELVKNRSFEFSAPLMGWKEIKEQGADGSILVLNRGQENPYNPRFIEVNSKSAAGYGLINEGFHGMGIKKNNRYHFSILAKQPETAELSLQIELVNKSGQVIGKTTVLPSSKAWKKYSASFIATETEAEATLKVLVKGKGSVDLDMISLFPQDTWKQRPGGLRADLVQKLADMKPGFLRFPGGCIVEGRELDTRYQWKRTIGDVANRRMIVNRWNTEFAHRPSPDYFQSFGLGFFEYFQLAEDIGASPLPIINCGMACQFNSCELVPVNQLGPYVQDALDLIEFANGSVNTTWGKKRAQLGHPKPFNLKMMGVGNEQWGPQYIERYKLFEKAIHAKYPQIKLVSSLGPNPDGEVFDYLDKTFRELTADILDEHYYRAPEWFLQNAKRYDNYDRKGPKIFAGEYAAQSVAIASPDNKNNWQCAMSEAAFMTGLERNADVVTMASYAPLFAHVQGWQWTPDLIWFDNLQSFGTPNYYVQQLYSLNKGTDVVPLTLNNEAVTGQDGCFASATLDNNNTHELIIKIVNTGKVEKTADFSVKGTTMSSEGTLTVLQSDDLNSVNSINEPLAICPKKNTLVIKDNRIKLTMKPYSFNIIRVSIAK